ncbi:YggS family pyridoxal phosphate-dependent enzyme [Enterococcus sp. BWB1-3]|uniref:YggS family pyridoxal phosphate-dependent enzyme n=1 Tax=unclassified Enterococcus TaxID=2608891 RepID=UPI0019210345|nr:MULTISPECIES: YggS family pyridoxal phosphate-dependent enzyme [unclassified Enterococcus]MBL1227868.1 YggS family pyridoxal phosphate-dependent enzyme [Enterococcus sp. BWB1-3]MCB5953132.1 YggS family pyridoxal phosphate-dependent enzyme [Enterococcus sp. BWT-B8]MCB5956160.1 YggS family pyridoxal phosphate-dependent enzyme [Enterococcus sp. CWB-B31]
MLADNLKEINENIELACENAHRSTSEVTLVAVTKSVDSETAEKLAELGVNNFAENRVDKLLEKMAALKNFSSLKWHLIGNLQRRKVKLVINDIDYFHALDSLSLAEEIQKRADKIIPCFIEVNVSEEESKHGIRKEELKDFISQLDNMDKICVIGLMTMAPLNADKCQLHEIFSELRQLQVMIKDLQLKHAPCTELSMGMSNDFPIAVEEGATFVRVGRGLFRGA